MKKITLVFTLLISMLLVGCSLNQPLSNKELSESKELIESAREEYEQLNSGSVRITNTETGELERTFIFMLDNDNVMHFSYCGENGDSFESQYYDGEQFIIRSQGKSETITKDDKNFPKFSEKKRHPNATGMMLIYEPSSVLEVEKITQGEEILIKHKYNPSSFSTPDEKGKLIEFDVTYHFDKNKKFTKLIEASKVSIDDETISKEYEITIDDKNELTSIPDFENGITE